MADNYITMLSEPSGLVHVKRDQPEPTLKEMQMAVGGLIEPVDQNCPKGVQAYVNEEGLYMGLLHNRSASDIVNCPNYLVGNCFIFFKDTNKVARRFFGV